jgi:hypothetical protein
MGIQNNVSNPVPLEQWKQIASERPTAQVVLDGRGGLTTGGDVGTLSEFEAQNKAAFDNLFTAIHSSVDEKASEVLRGLLEPTRDRGMALTPALIGHALHVAANFAPPTSLDLGVKWNQIGATNVLSPRTDLGRAFLSEFDVVLANQLTALYGAEATNDQMMQALEQMRREVIDGDGICPQIKVKIDSCLRTYQELIRFADLTSSLENPSLKLSDPFGDAYKLVMDGKHHDEGKFHFDNERGYLAGMLSALNQMLSQIEAPLTANMYESLHDAAVSDVHQRDKMGPESVFRQGFRDNQAVQFGLTDRNASESGRLEFNSSPKARDPENWISLVGSTESGIHGYLIANAKSKDDCRQKAQDIIDTYHQSIGRAGDDVSKLRCIAICCQDLDQHHLFADGNIRTAAFLTLNKLLLQNGMSPALFHDPNVLDLMSIDEIVNYIQVGQGSYQTLLEQ